MKKLLLVSLMVVGVGAVAMAKGYERFGGRCHGEGGYMMRNSKEFREARIQIDEIELANDKELLKDNPNFEIIEKNNLKIAEIRAGLKTEMMEARYNENKAKI